MCWKSFWRSFWISVTSYDAWDSAERMSHSRIGGSGRRRFYLRTKAKGRREQTFIWLILGIATSRIAMIRRMKWGWGWRVRDRDAFWRLAIWLRILDLYRMELWGCRRLGGLRPVCDFLYSSFSLFVLIMSFLDIEYADDDIGGLDGLGIWMSVGLQIFTKLRLSGFYYRV